MTIAGAIFVSTVAGAVMAIVTPMHEQVDDRTEQEQDVRRRTENVGLVFLPQKKERDAEKQAQAQPQGEAERAASDLGLSCCLHVVTSSKSLSLAGAERFILGVGGDHEQPLA